MSPVLPGLCQRPTKPVAPCCDDLDLVGALGTAVPRRALPHHLALLSRAVYSPPAYTGVWAGPETCPDVVLSLQIM